MSDEGIIGLAEAIHSVRQELVYAQELGAGSPLKFRIEPVELTMNIVVTKSGKVGVKAGFGPIGAEAGVDVDRAETHTVTVRMEPQAVGAQDGTYEGRDSVLIAGESGDGDPFERRRARSMDQ